ncbi:MAG TPA: SPOR domain-containing protein, partial [Leptolyngbyaceae cyanobacterium M65_K2018_010]|nr:SPOR domain-containing protein [Leptolyngbyaceae cyanobacterium M65_K2018_010]
PQPPLRVAPPAANAQPPQPLSPASTPAPPAPLPAPAASQASSPRPNYYVVTEYTGSQSLESARGAVNDAYVRTFNDGAKIQMGAFSQESSARNLAEQLQQQGIPAQVYTP